MEKIDSVVKQWNGIKETNIASEKAATGGDKEWQKMHKRLEPV